STQMVEALVNAGAYVNVVTAFPYYPQWKISAEYAKKSNYLIENHSRTTVYRYKQYVPAQPTFLKRIIHILSFTKGAFFNLRKIEKADLVISVIPFTTSAWLAGKHAKHHGIKSWVHIQDFEFDAAMQSGLSGGKGWIFNILFDIEKRVLNNATVVSTISHKMMLKLGSKTTSKQFYLPNWIDANMVDPSVLKTHRYLNSGKFKLLYSGNVGDKQDWDFFLAFAKALPQEFYEIIIVGAGSKYTTLKKMVNLPHVHFYKPVILSELSSLLCSADAHFLFQKTEVLDTVMPSKLLGMMASAKPSLVLGNADSEIREVMEAAQAGTYMSIANVLQAIDKVEEWRTQPAQRVIMGNHARDYVLKTFAREPILNKWIEALASL
ncbi:MAG: glycosyltransferase WbuB, partial [Nonlabens sp.]|nr:glycosyltransferase WbuB [Nonlabens sp.]